MLTVKLTEEQIFHLIDLAELDSVRIKRGDTLANTEEDRAKLTGFNKRVIGKLKRALGETP